MNTREWKRFYEVMFCVILDRLFKRSNDTYKIKSFINLFCELNRIDKNQINKYYNMYIQEDTMLLPYNKEVIHLMHKSNMFYQYEIALTLDISLGTVYNRLRDEYNIKDPLADTTGSYCLKNFFDNFKELGIDCYAKSGKHNPHK